MATSRRHLLQCAALALVGASGLARAQDAATFPQRPIRLLFSSSPGGLMDAAARLVGDRLASAWGHPVVVEARPGANGLIAATTLAAAKPDGYTLLCTNSGLLQASLFQPANSPLQLADLTPVFMLGIMDGVLSVHSAVPARTVQELISLVKAAPGTFSFGSTGQGSAGHLSGLMLNKVAGTDFVHVPYKGEPPALQDLMAGQIPVAITTVGGAARGAASGKVRPLAILGTRRLQALPGVPTLAEAGVDDRAALGGWVGFFAPKAMPRELLGKISAEMVRIALAPEFRAKALELGFESPPMGASEFAAFVRADVQKWANAVRETGYKHQLG
jgi:tripartite-type tricarboxylate transporter receptor subunit TctC